MAAVVKRIVGAFLIVGALASAAGTVRADESGLNSGFASNLDSRGGALHLTPLDNSALGNSAMSQAFFGDDGRLAVAGSPASGLMVTPRVNLGGGAEWGKGLTYFTPRGNSARIGIAPGSNDVPRSETTMLDTAAFQRNTLFGLSYSQTSFNAIEWALALGLTRSESRDRAALGLAESFALGAQIRYGGLSLGAGRSHAIETGIGEELFRRSLASGYDIGMSYAFDAGAVSVARLHGGTDWLNLGRNDRDTLRLSGRYLFGDIDLRAALAYSDALNSDPTRRFDLTDWALVTGFGLSF